MSKPVLNRARKLIHTAQVYHVAGRNHELQDCCAQLRNFKHDIYCSILADFLNLLSFEGIYGNITIQRHSVHVGWDLNRTEMK